MVFNATFNNISLISWRKHVLYYSIIEKTEKGQTLTIISFTFFQIRHATNSIKAKQSKERGIFTRKTKDDPIPPVMPPVGMLAVVTVQKFTYKTSCFGIMILLSKQSLHSLTSNSNKINLSCPFCFLQTFCNLISIYYFNANTQYLNPSAPEG
jgi:hypothetical protein